jgi:hypothetical protein
VTETRTALLNLLIFRTVISFFMYIQCTKFCRSSILICFFSHFFSMAWMAQVGTRYAPSICHANPPVFLKKKFLTFVRYRRGEVILNLSNPKFLNIIFLNITNHHIAIIY